jgi:taurine transport system substrate-binding protein
MRSLKIWILILLVAAFLLAACQPAATEEPAAEEPTEEMQEPTEEPTEEPVEEATEEPMEEATEEPMAEEEMAEEPMDAAAVCGEPEITDIALGFGVDVAFAPHIVAIQNGYFEEAGFSSVETPTFTAGALAGEALAAGEIQLWTPGNVPPISMRHNGMPIVITGINTAAYIEKFTARADAGIEEPEDLYNVRIALLEGSTASAVLANIANHYDLDVNQMEVVNLPPPEQLTSLINNDVQVMVVWNPWTWNAQQEEGLEVVVLHDGTTSYFPWDEGTEWQSSYTLSVWAMSEDFIRNNPNAACSIMFAMLRGQEYVANPDNREEVIQMVADWNDQPVELVEATFDDYDWDTTIDDEYVRDMQEYTTFLFDAGRIEEELDPLDYTYTGFLSQYNPDYVVLEGNWQP